MTTTELTHDQQISVLQHQINYLAWLHAELVVQLQTMIDQLSGQVLNANPAQAQAIRQRAARIARIRANQGGHL